MSAAATAWAWRQNHEDLDPLGKLVLLALADEASSSGLVIGCHQRVLADQCRTTRATVARKVTALRELGLVAVRVAGDNASANLYLVRLEAGVTMDVALQRLADDDPKVYKIVSALYAGGGAVVSTDRRTDTQEVLDLGLDLAPGGRSDRKPRSRDPIFDAIVEATNATVASESSLVARVKGQIMLALVQDGQGSMTPEEIAAEIVERARLYRAAFPKAALTPTALAKHWRRVSVARETADDEASVIEQLGLTGKLA